MSSPNAFTDIETRLKAAWLTTDLVFENEDYSLPATPAAFVYVEVFGDDYQQASVGEKQKNMFEEQGMTYLHVMVPNGTGTGLARDYANRLLNLFREQQVGSVITDRASIGSGNPGRPFANYWAMTVTLWWHRYDFTNLT